MTARKKVTGPQKHCWHETGASASLGTGQPVSAEVFCCFCGKTETVKWTITRRPKRGHGHHVTEAVHHYATSRAACPKRRDRLRRFASKGGAK